MTFDTLINEDLDIIVCVFIVGFFIGGVVMLHLFGVDNSCCGITYPPGQIWGGH